MEFKITPSLFLRVFINNYFIPTLLILLVIKSLSNWYHEFLNFNNSFLIFVGILVLIYITYCTYKISKEIIYSMNFSLELSDLKVVQDGESRLLSKYNLYSSFVEESKIRLDIYKSFTPLPIVVFLLGILIKWDFKRVSQHFENILNFKLELNYILSGTIFIVGIWYVISYRRCWVYHKNLLRRYTEVKTAYESLKVKRSE